MSERPIIMSGESVPMLLDGTKWQTRRLMNPQPDHAQYYEWRGKLVYEGEHRMWCWKTHVFDNLWDEYIRETERQQLAALCPLGVPGDQLWMRETCALWSYAPLGMVRFPSDDPRVPGACDFMVVYRAGYQDRTIKVTQPDKARGERWCPAIHVPRWASRLSLRITEVRVQLLQEISDDDAKAEGVSWTDYGQHEHQLSADGGLSWGVTKTQRAGWHYGRSTSSDQCFHTPRMAYASVWDKLHGAGSWGSNPWVFALSLEAIK